MLELFAMGFTRVKRHSWEDLLYRFEESNAPNQVHNILTYNLTLISRLEIFLLYLVLARLEQTSPVIILSRI